METVGGLMVKHVFLNCEVPPRECTDKLKRGVKGEAKILHEVKGTGACW